jgi:methionyl aminopeptidase
MVIALRSPRETEKMRKSGALAAKVLDGLVGMVQEGVTTEQLDAAAEKLMRDSGAVSASRGYRGYPAHICTSINEQIVHGIPGPRELKQGDIVGIDVCLELDGFFGDVAKTVAVGEVDKEKERLIAAAKQALEAGIEQARPGNRVHDISHAIEEVARTNGFSVVRKFTGHGIGRRMHEEPQIPNYGKPHTGPKILPGMMFAIEAMLNAGTHRVIILEDEWTAVTADSRPSAHFEHTVAVTVKGPEVMTCLRNNQ